jgi:hypothetical protein
MGLNEDEKGEHTTAMSNRTSLATMILENDANGKHVKLDGFTGNGKLHIRTETDGRLIIREAKPSDKNTIQVVDGKIHDKFMLMFFYAGEYLKMNFLKMGNTYYQVLKA